MKRAAILLSGLLLLTGCTAQEESISQHDIKIEKVKSKYGGLTNEDKNTNITMGIGTELVYPAPEYSTLVITNDGNNTYLVSPEYTIEKFIDGAWFEVALPKEFVIDGKTAYIGPGGRYHQKIKTPGDKNIYKSVGKYRVVKVLKPKEKNQNDVVLAHIITIEGKN